MWSVGTDTGGTFTDLVAIDDQGKVRVSKTPSTPPDFEQGVVDAIRAASLEPHDIRVFHHGTTVTTNALIERRGARTGLLATKGFRDILQLRDGSREEYYAINWDPPAPLVARPDRLGIEERVDAAGNVVVNLDEEQVRKAARTLRARGVESVAVAFLHAYANPEHERRALEILREELPQAYLCTSSETLPEPPEFERTSTTVANAYVGPVLGRYVSKLKLAVRELGYEGSVLIMHSGGGSMTPENALRVPIRTATSGPAGGVMAAAAIARGAGRPNAISLDMGGTSADIATIQDGEPRVTVEQTVEWGMPVGFPCIDLIAIGAGGGSIAWVDEAGAPHVGPQSAGARPGPACYGGGGTEATACDANVALGRLRPASLLGGGMTLDPSLAHEAVARFAARIGLDATEAANGIVRIANEHMAHGIRRMTIKRGLDPREFVLIAFGGAGPMHAAEIARELKIPEVLVPPHPGATSALGLVSADARHDLLRSHITPTSDADPDAVEALFEDMEAEARELLRNEGFSDEDMRLERLVDLRYIGQVRSLTLPAGDGPTTRESLVSLTERFHDAYEQEFKYAVRNLPVETRAVRVSAIGPTDEPDFAGAAPANDGDASSAIVATDLVAFAETGAVETPFYDRVRLRPGMRFAGPAIVEQYDATTVVPPRTEVEVDRHTNLVLRVEA